MRKYITILILLVFSFSLLSCVPRVAKKGDEVKVWIEKAELAFRNKEWDKLIEYLNKIIKFRPNDYRAYYNRATCYKEKRLYYKAIDDYTKIIQLKPDFPDAYFKRGLAYYEKGYYNRSIKRLYKSIRA